MSARRASGRLPKGERMPRTIYVPDSAWGRLIQLGICTSRRTLDDVNPDMQDYYMYTLSRRATRKAKRR